METGAHAAMKVVVSSQQPCVSGSVEYSGVHKSVWDPLGAPACSAGWHYVRA